MSTSVAALQTAPMTQVAIGEISLTYVPDGHILVRPEEMFYARDPMVWDRHPERLDGDGRLLMSVGAWLVRGPRFTALIDLGVGPRRVTMAELHYPRVDGEIVGGELIENLARAGIAPEDVDVVLITHLDGCHLGWLADDAQLSLRFAAAAHLVGGREWSVATGPAASRPARSAADWQLELLRDRLVLMQDGDRPAPGLAVWETPGHTPGHLSFEIAWGAERAVVLGDLIHSPIELAEPGVTFIGDANPRQAARTRARVLGQLLATRAIVGAGYFCDGALGRVVPPTSQPRWEPLH